MFNRWKTSEITGFCGKLKVEALSNPRSRFFGPAGQRDAPRPIASHGPTAQQIRAAVASDLGMDRPEAIHTALLHWLEQAERKTAVRNRMLAVRAWPKTDVRTA